MLNQKDILQTQDMIDKRHLDIRTITMGISLLDCCDPDLKTCCDKIYRKITRCAKDLVKVGEDIDALIAELNDDTGMPETGYAVFEVDAGGTDVIVAGNVGSVDNGMSVTV